MNTNHIGPVYPATIGEQATAITALTGLCETYGRLPAAYITVNTTHGSRLDLQLDGPNDFEAWREALNAPAGLVSWHVYNASVWISVDAEFHGAKIRLSGHNVPVPLEIAKVSPAEDAERYHAAQLVEQHHQADDPAEPDPGAYIGLPGAWVATVPA